MSTHARTFKTGLKETQNSFAITGDGLKGRSYNDITMIEAKSWDTLSFKQHTSQNTLKGGVITGLTVKRPKETTQMGQHQLKCKCCCYGEIKSVQKLCDCTT
jgi:hypothetical protein